VTPGKPLVSPPRPSAAPFTPTDKEKLLTDDPTTDGHPDHWSDAARDAVAEVLDVRPDLDGADLASLREAAELITAADALAAVARAVGYVATGSTGQTVTHPAQVESRLCRTAAASVLARLTAPAAGGAETLSQRQRRLAQKRHGRG
jgi:hypothetical protein